ncbi:MAG: DUF998 domain-containing protein [Promethearchaeota archaeon]
MKKVKVLKEKTMKKLYLGGIIGPIVFLLNDIIGTIITPGYSQVIHAVSELTQAGAENAVLLSSLFLIAAIGLIIFGIGLVAHYNFKTSKAIFLGGIFIISLGILSALTGTIFPMDPFGEDATFAGNMHQYLTYVNIALIVLAIPMIGIGLYKEKQWKLFIIYSIITVITMVICGVLTGVLTANNIEMLGLFERITIYAYQTWILILAVLLIKE